MDDFYHLLLAVSFSLIYLGALKDTAQASLGIPVAVFMVILPNLDHSVIDPLIKLELLPRAFPFMHRSFTHGLPLHIGVWFLAWLLQHNLLRFAILGSIAALIPDLVFGGMALFSPLSPHIVSLSPLLGFKDDALLYGPSGEVIYVMFFAQIAVLTFFAVILGHTIVLTISHKSLNERE